MSEFLVGDELSAKIREVVQGENVRCAVAFWGRGAVEELFGANFRKLEDVHIVCDLSMGGTNPETLRALGAPKNPNLRVRNGLHAKVFLSSKGAIVGSANASNNGIGFMGGEAHLLEAGAYFSANSDTCGEIEKWLEKLSTEKMSEPLDNQALKSAQDAWSKRCHSSNQLRPGQQISFLDYDPKADGLVLPCWFEGGGDQASDDAAIADNGRSYMYFADRAGDIMSRWVCAFAINDGGGLYEGGSPYFFFVTDFVENENNDDETNPHLAFQLAEAQLPGAPFKFDEAQFSEAFCAVVDQDEYDNLRGLPDKEDWLARDHIELMHRFWRDVQKEYRRLQDQT